MNLLKQIKEVELPENYKELPALEQLKFIWPIIKVLLSMVEFFTGEKGDAKIEAVKKWGDENIR